MHDMNLLPQTESIKRQSRLLLITTIGLNIAAAFWITTTSLAQNDLKTYLQGSITATENRIVPVPPLTNRANALRNRVNDQESTNTYVQTFPTTTAALMPRLNDVFTAVPNTEPPTMTIDRITVTRNETQADIEVAGKTKILSSIQTLITGINERGISVLPANINQEADGTFTFSVVMAAELTPNTPDQAVDFIQPNITPDETPSDEPGSAVVDDAATEEQPMEPTSPETTPVPAVEEPAVNIEPAPPSITAPDTVPAPEPERTVPANPPVTAPEEEPTDDITTTPPRLSIPGLMPLGGPR